MSYVTNWGYELTDAQSLADIITVEEFNTFTAGRYSGDVRIPSGIAAASLALRNHCGWHLSGSLACKISWTINNRGIVRNGRDLLIQLPTRSLSGITSVKIGGEETTDYTYQTNGMLTVYDVCVSDRRDIVEVEFTSGIFDDSAIKELCAQMVTFGLARSYGVTSEAAGGVSITYNSAWTNGSFNSIMGNNAGLLAPYRLEGVF